MLGTEQNSNQCREVVGLSNNQPFAHMQKNMMDEMDKRRAEWEKEVGRMAEDFFQVVDHS